MILCSPLTIMELGWLVVLSFNKCFRSGTRSQILHRKQNPFTMVHSKVPSAAEMDPTNVPLQNKWLYEQLKMYIFDFLTTNRNTQNRPNLGCQTKSGQISSATDIVRVMDFDLIYPLPWLVIGTSEATSHRSRQSTMWAKSSMNNSRANRPTEQSTSERWSLRTNTNNLVLINKRTLCMPDSIFLATVSRNWR